MTEYQTIKLVDDGDVVSLTLNRPPLNVMNIAMMQEMNAALASLRNHPRLKVLVIQAEGKAFSAGVDVADHTADKVDGMMREFLNLFNLLHGLKCATVAAVDGAALGGGCEVALFCDMVIASERAKFGQPEIKVGVFPPIAAAVVPRLIGRGRALEFLMSGDNLSAVEAERLGLINCVFPVEHFPQHVQNFVKRLSGHSKIILEMTKQAVDDGLTRARMSAVDHATDFYMNEMMKTEDAHEGLDAFLQKRQPVWKNQ
jgi:cyclohexa-1,5-dienecarbonyl-CoA hydratase